MTASHGRQLPNRDACRCAGRDPDDEGQDHQSKDIVDDGRAEDRLADCAERGDTQLTQGRGADADAGRGEHCSRRTGTPVRHSQASA